MKKPSSATASRNQSAINKASVKQTAVKAADKNADKSTDKSTDKSADKTADKSARSSARAPTRAAKRTRPASAQTIAPITSPGSKEMLIASMAQHFPQLSKQLKKIAQFVDMHGNRIGLMGVQALAAECQVLPSAIVRFAKYFGYSGFSEMQQVFKVDLHNSMGVDSNNYQARLRHALQGDGATPSVAQVVHNTLSSSIEGMQRLQANLDEKQINIAVDLLRNTQTVWLAGSRRSFAVAIYLSYMLQHTQKNVQLISGLGHMQTYQLNAMRKGDLLVAASFAPYAEETLSAALEAKNKGLDIIAITDSRLSPLAQGANAVLIAEESQTLGFRTLSNAMALAQSLFIAFSYANEIAPKSQNTAS